jgi:Na+/H+ antiporter NhaD/arsenite permease-like protein
VDWTILLIFGFVYVGMLLGEIPGLKLDRTGVALLGAIALLAFEKVRPEEAWKAIDVPTITLLFALMVVSAQFRLGGFYAAVTRRLAAAGLSPPALLAVLIVVVAALAAILANDIVCLACAPVLVEGCARRKLDPVPFLLGLATAANVGSAATLIGNPQNMLVGQTLGLSFAGYLLDGGVPAVLGLGAVWAVIAWRVRGRWHKESPVPEIHAPPLDRWQTVKGLVVVAGLMIVFVFLPWPREVAALAAAGILLLSLRMASAEMLALVDWHLLVLFMSLFVVNHALNASGMVQAATAALADRGFDPHHPGVLFVLSMVLSNIVSNVPAVMLLLPSATHELAGPILALSSTLAGNLLIVGSIANIIVVDQAARQGVTITWREYARVGVPVTLLTLAVAAGWLVLRQA